MGQSSQLSSLRFGAVIKKLRVSAGYLSGRDFAKACGLSRETVRNYESGKTLPSNESLLQILKTLDVKPGSTGSIEIIAALHEARRSKTTATKRSYGAAANFELSKYLRASDISEEKIEQLLTLFTEYISPDRQSASLMHFLRQRITKILE